MQNWGQLCPQQRWKWLYMHSFISSRLDYCNSLFTCLSNSSLKRLQVVQNAAAKLLTKSSKRSHVTPTLISLHWLPVKFRIHFKILIMVFRALHGESPVYIKGMLKPYNSIRNLRSSNQILLVVPRSRLKTKGDCAFEVVAPKLWKALPLELRSVDSVDIFEMQLKTHLFKLAFVIFFYFFIVMSTFILHWNVLL